MPKIGAYICHCGINIASSVDVEKVRQEAEQYPSVAVARTYEYMCSDPGQELIKSDIKEYGLDRIVVAACSPRMHEVTFRKACEAAGVNAYCFDMANIREQCSWVHDDKNEATAKAIDLLRSSLSRASLLQPLTVQEVPVTPAALVVGGGIAGIQAALDIADAGFQVHMVEKEPTIGGHMAQLDKTFPTLDCSACILTPKMVDVAQHENIDLHTYSEVERVEGFVGNFKVKIKQKNRHVDFEKCTGCDLCTTNCLVSNIPQKRKVYSVKSQIDNEMLTTLDELVMIYGKTEDALIQILQEVNRKFRYLPETSLRYISEVMNISLSRIYHLATFYNAFSLNPVGDHIIKVCIGTACHTRGATDILDRIETILEIRPGDTTDDGMFTLQTVGCLGCCALGPVVQIDENYHQMVPGKVEKIIKAYK
jgi:NADH:ubiquinone oxidoreductase subunit E